jgi:hypothetical protein
MVQKDVVTSLVLCLCTLKCVIAIPTNSEATKEKTYGKRQQLKPGWID